MNRKILDNLRAHILETFNVDMSKKNIESLREIIDYIDDEVTGRYFSDTGTPNSAYWKPDNNWHVKRSGKVLVDRMKEETWETWLDVGCGDNKYKPYFGDKVTGIDPYNEHADIVVSCLDFEPPHQYDIVTAMGSINFGDRAKIQAEVEKCVSFCKPGGKLFWRFNPGITHDDPQNMAFWVDFFEWSEGLVYEFADLYNCTVDDFGWDNPETHPTRIRYGPRHYSEWTKK